LKSERMEKIAGCGIMIKEKRMRQERNRLHRRRHVWLGLALLAASSRLMAQAEPKACDEGLTRLLNEIYAQVKEMGPHHGDLFIKRMFFVGEDDDDTNKDIHVGIAIQNEETHDRMTIQVAYMKRDRRNRRVATTIDSKVLSCRLEEGQVLLTQTDYAEKEMKEFLRELLRAILNKKRLLRRSTA